MLGVDVSAYRWLRGVCGVRLDLERYEFHHALQIRSLLGNAMGVLEAGAFDGTPALEVL